MAREKVILFDGTNLDKWVKWTLHNPAPWRIDEEGAMVAGGGNILTKDTYKDAHIHVEFWLPKMPDDCVGQARANSGVYVHGCYEIQVLDSFGIEVPQKNDCGAIYDQKAPDVNANIEPEKWQTYDIYFRAPRFNENKEKIENARMTVIFNGKCIHNNIVLPTNTPGGVPGMEVEEGPLMLQDHWNPVRFRNVWFERL